MPTIRCSSNSHVAEASSCRSSPSEMSNKASKAPSVKATAHPLLDGLESAHMNTRSIVDTDHAPASTRSRPPRLLAHAVGPRELTLEQRPNGQTPITMKYPPIEQLVLSGGGAKGAAYPGAILALEDGGIMPASRAYRAPPPAQSQPPCSRQVSRAVSSGTCPTG